MRKLGLVVVVAISKGGQARRMGVGVGLNMGTEAEGVVVAEALGVWQKGTAGAGTVPQDSSERRRGTSTRRMASSMEWSRAWCVVHNINLQ